MVKLNKKSIEYLNDVYIKILKQYYDTLDLNIIKEIIDIIKVLIYICILKHHEWSVQTRYMIIVY